MDKDILGVLVDIIQAILWLCAAAFFVTRKLWPRLRKKQRAEAPKLVQFSGSAILSSAAIRELNERRARKLNRVSKVCLILAVLLGLFSLSDILISSPLIFKALSWQAISQLLNLLLSVVFGYWAWVSGRSSKALFSLFGKLPLPPGPDTPAKQFPLEFVVEADRRHIADQAKRALKSMGASVIDLDTANPNRQVLVARKGRARVGYVGDATPYDELKVHVVRKKKDQLSVRVESYADDPSRDDPERHMSNVIEFMQKLLDV